MKNNKKPELLFHDIYLINFKILTCVPLEAKKSSGFSKSGNFGKKTALVFQKVEFKIAKSAVFCPGFRKTSKNGQKIAPLFKKLQR